MKWQLWILISSGIVLYTPPWFFGTLFQLEWYELFDFNFGTIPFWIMLGVLFSQISILLSVRLKDTTFKKYFVLCLSIGLFILSMLYGVAGIKDNSFGTTCITMLPFLIVVLVFFRNFKVDNN